MQDRHRQLDENLLRRTAGPYIRVDLGRPGATKTRLLFLQERTVSTDRVTQAEMCQTGPALERGPSSQDVLRPCWSITAGIERGGVSGAPVPRGRPPRQLCRTREPPARDPLGGRARRSEPGRWDRRSWRPPWPRFCRRRRRRAQRRAARPAIKSTNSNARNLRNRKSITRPCSHVAAGRPRG